MGVLAGGFTAAAISQKRLDMVFVDGPRQKVFRRMLILFQGSRQFESLLASATPASGTPPAKTPREPRPARLRRLGLCRGAAQRRSLASTLVAWESNVAARCYPNPATGRSGGSFCFSGRYPREGCPRLGALSGETMPANPGPGVPPRNGTQAAGGSSRKATPRSCQLPSTRSRCRIAPFGLSCNTIASGVRRPGVGGRRDQASRPHLRNHGATRSTARRCGHPPGGAARRRC